VAAFVPLVDSAVLIAAHDKGFMRLHGIELTLVKEPSWASLRDHLNLGHVDCAQALGPLPIASSLGVGQVQVDMAVPFVLGRGGNAVTVSNALGEEMERLSTADGLGDPRAGARALAAVIRDRDEPFTFGMVYPFSAHNFDLRYWLASAGVHPDRDVRLVAIPPPLMVESLRAGHVDGFCVGEPWNSLAVAEGFGRIVVTKSQMFPRGVEKVLAIQASTADEPERLDRLIRGLSAAAQWCDEPGHHAELAELLARPEYLGVSPALIERSLGGRLALGHGAWLDDPNFLHFHRDAANRPHRAEALWIYAQMVRWGQLKPLPELEERAARVFRADLYQRALGVTDVPPIAMAPPYDGIEFSADDLQAYLGRFALHTQFIESASNLQS
jgi:ABC-type nitrate/sulfonate/bicarbonate transport system substrate-binding protein